jgi:hypothetical protein
VNLIYETVSSSVLRGLWHVLWNFVDLNRLLLVSKILFVGVKSTVLRRHELLGTRIDWKKNSRGREREQSWVEESEESQEEFVTGCSLLPSLSTGVGLYFPCTVTSFTHSTLGRLLARWAAGPVYSKSCLPACPDQRQPPLDQQQTQAWSWHEHIVDSRVAYFLSCNAVDSAYCNRIQNHYSPIRLCLTTPGLWLSSSSSVCYHDHARGCCSCRAAAPPARLGSDDRTKKMPIYGLSFR